MSLVTATPVTNSTLQNAGGVIGPFGIDNLVLLATAIIGLTGSYVIYRLRLRTRRRRLRKALRGEIKAMAPSIYEKARIMSAEDRDSDFYLPTDPTIMTVFSNNSGEIGLLSDDEVEEITDFYSKAAVVSQRIQNLNAIEDPNKASILQLREDLVRLNNTKNVALSELERALGVDLTTGDVYQDLEDPGFDYLEVLEEELDEE
jgi:hypothetical protein